MWGGDRTGEGTPGITEKFFLGQSIIINTKKKKKKKIKREEGGKRYKGQQEAKPGREIKDNTREQSTGGERGSRLSKLQTKKENKQVPSTL